MMVTNFASVNIAIWKLPSQKLLPQMLIQEQAAYNLIRKREALSSNHILSRQPQNCAASSTINASKMVTLDHVSSSHHCNPVLNQIHARVHLIGRIQITPRSLTAREFEKMVFAFRARTIEEEQQKVEIGLSKSMSHVQISCLVRTSIYQSST